MVRKSLLMLRCLSHRTPLHCAAAEGHVDVCEFLVQAGASVDANDDLYALCRLFPLKCTARLTLDQPSHTSAQCRVARPHQRVRISCACQRQHLRENQVPPPQPMCSPLTILKPPTAATGARHSTGQHIVKSKRSSNFWAVLTFQSEIINVLFLYRRFQHCSRVPCIQRPMRQSLGPLFL
jgi:hypothetical protein